MFAVLVTKSIFNYSTAIIGYMSTASYGFLKLSSLCIIQSSFTDHFWKEIFGGHRSPKHQRHITKSSYPFVARKKKEKKESELSHMNTSQLSIFMWQIFDVWCVYFILVNCWLCSTDAVLLSLYNTPVTHTTLLRVGSSSSPSLNYLSVTLQYIFSPGGAIIAMETISTLGRARKKWSPTVCDLRITFITFINFLGVINW